MSILNKFLVAATCISLTACVQKDEPPSALARAIPTADQVAIKLPDNGNRALGDLAEFYVTTRDITRTFNGASAWVLILIHTIVQFPVTTVADNTYTWGPFSDALDPAEYKLTVIDNGDNTYAYALAGRSKIDGGDFEDVITGLADDNAGEGLGNGLFKLDFEAGRRVNPIDADPEARGTVEVVYDLADKAQVMHIVSTDDAGAPVEANYAYNEGEDGSGEHAQRDSSAEQRRSISLPASPAAPSHVSACTRKRPCSTSTAMVPGVKVIELACITRPISVCCEGTNSTRVGEIGNDGDRMRPVTSQPDFTISLTSHGQ